MRNHTIEIGDRRGHSFKIHISTPSTGGELIGGIKGDWDTWTLQSTGGPRSPLRANMMPGDWRTIDKGFIRYNSGRVLRSTTHDGSIMNIDIYLANLDGTWGMKLFEYESKFGGANDEGEGFVIQPWVMGIDEGRISWSLVD